LEVKAVASFGDRVLLTRGRDATAVFVKAMGRCTTCSARWRWSA